MFIVQYKREHHKNWQWSGVFKDDKTAFWWMARMVCKAPLSLLWRVVGS